MNKILIELDSVDVGYNGHLVLKNIHLKIYERDFLGIIGPNGGGKTTLVKLILGLLKPERGTIRLANNELKKQMGYMPQTNQVDKRFPILVSEVIASGLMSEKNLLASQKKERINRMVEEMGLEEIRNNSIGELSGGQLQRTLLARAIINDPALLILDEPNSYVDKQFESHFYELLQKINQQTAIVLVSHDIDTVTANVKNIIYVNESLEYRT